MSVIRELRKAACGLWSLIVGLKITGDAFFRKQITVHYPRTVIDDENLRTFRGHLEMVARDDAPNIPKCISCGMCANFCPSACLTLVKRKPPKPTPEQNMAMVEAEARGEKVKKPAAPKDPAALIHDFTLCSLCGTCVDNCPSDAIRFSMNIYQAGFKRADFTYDLVQRLQEQAGGAGKEEKKVDA